MYSFAQKEVNMSVKTVLLILYAVSLVCCQIMRKLEPDNKWYPIYVSAICAVLTVFLLNLPA